MNASLAPKYDFLQQEKPVYSGDDALLKFGKWLTLQKQLNRLTVLCDKNTAVHCLPSLMKFLPEHLPVSEIVIEAGEGSKSISVCREIWTRMTHLEIGRSDLLINLGGGVVSDTGGFVAAAYLRGIRFVNIPTSLMAMVDAGLGGKTGVDLDHIKNRIGLVAFPECTVCYPGFLSTLPDTEWKSGCAEVLKHALIADPELWKMIVEQGCGKPFIALMLPRIQRVKMEVVHIDPYEKGLRKILNFGHTIGHALESQSLSAAGNPLTHGQAVAMGMVLEAEVAHRMNKITNGEADEIKRILELFFGRTYLGGYSVTGLLRWMRYDKKNTDGDLMMSLLTGIGSCDWNVKVEQQLIADVLLKYGAQHD